MMKKPFISFALTLVLCACTVGPNYSRPKVVVPEKFKEIPKGWKSAQPRDTVSRGDWWKIFKDEKLNFLENQLNSCNQSIATAEANYRQALALIDEAASNYYPVISTSASLTRQWVRSSGSSNFQTSSSPGSGTSVAVPGATTTSTGTASGGRSNGVSHSLLFNASWEPDIWGTVRRTVEANIAGAQASQSLLASTRLISQATLAQTYFQLRTLDTDQQLLDKSVRDYTKALQLTQNRYALGVAARTDVVQAQTQLETAQALAASNGINRAKYEHAIAVLIGRPPEFFSIAFNPLKTTPPYIPVSVPSEMLERRPDVAQAERLMAQANAQIGVAISAYFPTLGLTATGSYAHKGYNNWLSIPGLNWSVGPQLAETIFDGGLRSATTAAARAVYDSTVASYRQIVLAAFQDTEDNLVSVRLLKTQVKYQRQAAVSARTAATLVYNQYKAGLVAYTDVIVAQNLSYTAERNASDVVGLQMNAAVGLIKALGGGWNNCVLDCH